MRHFVPSSLILLASFALCGCGGKDHPTDPTDDPTGGTIALSGGVSQQLTAVVFTGTFDPTSGAKVMATVEGPVDVSVEITFRDDLQTGSWTEMTTPGPSFAAISVIGETGAWSAIGSEGIVLRGVFDLTITSVGTAVTSQGIKTYSDLHGSLNATLPAVAGGASTPVTFVGSF